MLILLLIDYLHVQIAASMHSKIARNQHLAFTALIWFQKQKGF